MIWLLDTNVLIRAARGQPPGVRNRLGEVSPEDVAVSSVSLAELWYAAEKSEHPARKRASWSEFLEPFEILPFDRPAAEQHARVRYALRRNPIGDRDLLIAAIALANGLTVVTQNTREFGRVPGLAMEDWSTG
ncbi:MAG: type II toxin-antitoxin system VapC family toxin [Gemmatimonadetes bacterium]|nr:type II toxin-antitoxin system VapC family toxin [Gemmatimonadota bacterium]